MNMIRKVKFRYDLLDYKDQYKGELKVIKASVGMNSLAQIKRTGSFTIIEDKELGVDYLNDRICPFMLEEINGEWVESPLGVYLMPSPSRYTKNNVIYRDIQAYDTTQILKEDKFRKRMYYKKGMKYTEVITQIIHSANVYKTKVTNSESVLNRDREFEPGMSKIDVVNELLKEINYTSIYTDELGFFVAKPYELPSIRDIELSYRNDEISEIIADTYKDEIDTFNVPNVWVATASNAEGLNLRSEYENSDPASVLSTYYRKRSIVQKLEVNDIADQASLDNYVKRIANNTSTQYQKAVFETLKKSNHGYSNVLYLEHDKLAVQGKYIETAWSMDLSVEGTMKHEARKVINI